MSVHVDTDVSDAKGRKRAAEVSLIIDAIREHLDRAGPPDVDRRILEFGTGNGFQIDQLRSLGTVTGSDVYVSDELGEFNRRSFVCCSMSEAPFADASFDVIFSNHVLEHIDDLEGALSEAARIGRPDCLYAFSVPTALWLLLSVPEKVTYKVRRVSHKTLGRLFRSGDAAGRSAAPARAGDAPQAKGPFLHRLLSFVRIHGHGVYDGFFECWAALRIRRWQQVLRASGYEIVESRPLLIYGPTGPYFPAKSLLGRHPICSSMLFVLRRAQAEPRA